MHSMKRVFQASDVHLVPGPYFRVKMTGQGAGGGKVQIKNAVCMKAKDRKHK